MAGCSPFGGKGREAESRLVPTRESERLPSHVSSGRRETLSLTALFFRLLKKAADICRFLALRRLGLIAGSVAWLGMASAWPAQEGRPGESGLLATTAVRIEESLVLDGRLDEESWSQAPPVTGFLQKEPREGAPASEKTEVRILFDARNIYFGVFCYDSNPGGIRATELRRDDPFRNDDIFELILDTFHDHRNGYLFRINPLGTKYDATVANDGLTINENWDEKWEVGTQITEQGWSAEISIPFKSLRFLSDERIVWGVNFHRDIKRKNEEVFWTAFNRDFSFEEVSQAGHLEGLTEIQGFTFRLKPYFTTGGSHVVRDGQNETEHLTDIGIEDAKYLITPQLALDLTVNPDFAQADVDEAQVNLTRFSRFFPEKREFFQERAGIFQFGTGERSGRPHALLFHSRRIGLSEDQEEIPIWGGLKLTGKQGPLDLGVLNMQTKREGSTPGQNFTAVRVKGNILARSYVGAIFTRNTAGLEGDGNQAAGVDGSFTFFRNLNLRGFLTKSDSAQLQDGQWAGQGLIDWESDRIEFSLEHVNIQEDFNPEMGFVLRDNIKRTVAEFDYQPRPNIDLIRQLEFGATFDYIANQEGQMETRVFELEWSAEFESGDDMNLTFLRTFERLVDPFPIRGSDVAVPVGDYEFNELQATYRAFRGRKLSGNLEFSTGGFFNGSRTRFAISPQFKPTQNLSFEPGYEWNKISLPEISFITQEFNGEVNYSFSQKWLTRTTFLLDSQEQEYTVNFRLNYIFRPGDDLFVVYNETRSYGTGGQLQNRALIVKLTFSLDM